MNKIRIAAAESSLSEISERIERGYTGSVKNRIICTSCTWHTNIIFFEDGTQANCNDNVLTALVRNYSFLDESDLLVSTIIKRFNKSRIKLS